MSRYRLNQAAKMIGVAGITLKRALLSGRVDEVQRDRNGWRIVTDEDIVRLRSYFNATKPPVRMPLFKRLQR
jgi:DNA (cytosine-5)-methyltransferase 1